MPAWRTSLERAARALDRVERDAPRRLDVPRDRAAGRGAVARLEAGDDRGVLVDEVPWRSRRPPRITCIIRFTESSR